MRVLQRTQAQRFAVLLQGLIVLGTAEQVVAFVFGQPRLFVTFLSKARMGESRTVIERLLLCPSRLAVSRVQQGALRR